MKAQFSRKRTQGVVSAGAQMRSKAVWLVWAAVFLAAGLFFGCNVNVQEQSVTTPIHTIRQLTDDGWLKADVAWSPDGLKIAYSQTQMTSILRATPVRESDEIDIIGSIVDNIDYQNLAFSPDGEQVVYRSNRNSSLWVVNLRNLSERMLLPEGVVARDPDWSPRGGRIAFSAEEEESGKSAIWIIETMVGALPDLVFPADSARSFANPSWAPDETAIACQSDSNEIFIIDLAAQSFFVIASDSSDSTFYSSPSWSPVADTIAYSVFRNGVWRIELMATTGGAVRTVTPQFRTATNPAWSPDGSQLAFNSRSAVWVVTLRDMSLQQTDLSEPRPVWLPNSNSLLEIERVSAATLHVVSSDEGSPFALPQSPEYARDVAPAWSRDSQRITFVRHDEESEFSQIRQFSLANKTEVALLEQSVYPEQFDCVGCFGNPAISPADGRVVFDDNRDIFLLQDGEPPLNLSGAIPDRLRQPAWSHDGKQIACVSDNRLIIYEFRTNALVERRSIDGSFANPAWAATHPVYGEKIAVERWGGVYVFKPDGGAPEFIVAGRYPAWAPSGVQISFVQGNNIHIADVFVAGN